jgi:subtilisin
MTYKNAEMSKKSREFHYTESGIRAYCHLPISLRFPSVYMNAISVLQGLRVAMSCLLAFMPVVGAAETFTSSSHQTVIERVVSQESVSVSQNYIVLLKDESNIDDVIATHKTTTFAKFESTVKGFAGTLDENMLSALKKDDRVLLVEPDYVVTAFAQTMPTGINRMEADLSPLSKIDQKDERVNVDIAIIDTGIDLDHKDLNVYRNVNFIRSWRSGDDDNGHGTHVAGTAGAKDNTIGAVGAAPGARLWAVKVLDSRGSGLMSTIIAGIDYVTQHADEIDVANLSLGCNCVSQALNEAINRATAKGVVFVVAAGNDNKDASTYSPANHPDVITVSAIADFDGKAGGLARSTCYADVDDTVANFSNKGSAVDIAAPGVCIYSTWKSNSYKTISGTSMASPHVAGAAALYIASHGKPTDLAGATAVKNALITAATPQDGIDGFSGDNDGFKEPLLKAQNL